VRAHHETRRQRAPIWTVTAGLLLAISAQLLLLMGYSEVPEKASLQAISGNITTAKMMCAKGGCQALFQIEDAGGIWNLAYNDNTAEARRLVRLLSPGDVVHAFALLPDREQFQWLWELRRGDEVMLSYEQRAWELHNRLERSRGASSVDQGGNG
jgi:hypothetical protein